jgi:very-short-patch-repair endonuclease
MSYSYRVLRFSNSAVQHDLPGVLETIAKEIRFIMIDPPPPSA